MTHSARKLPGGALGLARLAASILLVLAASGLAAAEDPTPPMPFSGPGPSGAAGAKPLAPAQPAAGQAILYEQMDAGEGTLYILSQDSIDNQYDTLAADDFSAPSVSSSWQVSAVEVGGQYHGAGGAISVDSVNIRFYADAGGLPGFQVYAGTSVPVSGTTSNGNYFLPLSPAAELATNTTYWVSVQAHQSTTWLWYWSERTTQNLSRALWQNPSNGSGTGCTNWTPIAICFPNTGPDLLFRLYGTESGNQVTPILFNMDPDHAANRSFTLSASGFGFANGAVLNFGPTGQYPTTVSGSANLSTVGPIPASEVVTYGATITVSVTNPGPCSGSCTSNELLFTVKNLVYVPLVRR